MISIGLELITTSLIPLLAAALVSMLITWRLIPFLKKVRSTQTIHEDAPDSHNKKSGTPTMGGVAIILGIMVGCAIAVFLVKMSLNLLVILGVLLSFGLVGFLDDYTKVAKRRNLGLTAKQKIAFQLGVSLFVALYYVFVAQMGTKILIPFVWKSVDIGYFMIPYIMFIMVAMVNAVNLTDGLDGLAAGVSTILSLFFPIICILGMHLSFNLLSGPESATAILNSTMDAMFFFSLAGACLGFLVFNRHPAKIFMGDTGSLALGGGIAAAAIFTRMELFLPIIGLLFVLEALSDIIQVAYFKISKGKRIFKMAPLHHHFELSGWSETKVVSVFTGITLLLCLISVGVMCLQYVGR
ncbi:MAG: phospho-N-acetylmuramoyl-pentapeptide-transferase [Clostridiales Family XIII bacterium]|jgi:phospho-N-acetylmuramoyl-pentapeptide-transferase|nr:phospho-N-acetylmuramoyl-pentapeptide-transferase [Clostridiales Family XIII bacterium]